MAAIVAAVFRPHDTVSLQADGASTAHFEGAAAKVAETVVTAPRPEASASVARETIGWCTILQQLRRSGQGAVYRASHPRLPLESPIEVGRGWPK